MFYVVAAFFFFQLHLMVCRILVPQPRIEPAHLLWKCRVLTTGPQGSPSMCVDRISGGRKEAQIPETTVSDVA